MITKIIAKENKIASNKVSDNCNVEIEPLPNLHQNDPWKVDIKLVMHYLQTSLLQIVAGAFKMVSGSEATWRISPSCKTAIWSPNFSKLHPYHGSQNRCHPKLFMQFFLSSKPATMLWNSIQGWKGLSMRRISDQSWHGQCPPAAVLSTR